MAESLDLLRTNLTRYLKRAGWTQRDLADRMGDHRVMVGRWLNGTTAPSLEKIGLMSKALGVPIAALFAGEGTLVPNAHHTYEDCLQVVCELVHSAGRKLQRPVPEEGD